MFTNRPLQCDIYVAVEGGLGTGIDPVELTGIGLIWSTASLSDFTGLSANASADVGVPTPVGFPIGMTFGVSSSLDNKCNTTAFIGYPGLGATGSITLGHTWSLWNDTLQQENAVISMCEAVRAAMLLFLQATLDELGMR